MIIKTDHGLVCINCVITQKQASQSILCFGCVIVSDKELSSECSPLDRLLEVQPVTDQLTAMGYRNSPVCTCLSRDLFNHGCRCGHLSRKA